MKDLGRGNGFVELGGNGNGLEEGNWHSESRPHGRPTHVYPDHFEYASDGLPSRGAKCNEEILGSKGAGYRGCQTRTRSGHVCQKWSLQKPRTHTSVVKDDHNYCRNGGPSRDTIWCYIHNGAYPLSENEFEAWEYCDPINFGGGGTTAWDIAGLTTASLCTNMNECGGWHTLVDRCVVEGMGAQFDPSDNELETQLGRLSTQTSPSPSRVSYGVGKFTSGDALSTVIITGIRCRVIFYASDDATGLPQCELTAGLYKFSETSCPDAGAIKSWVVTWVPPSVDPPWFLGKPDSYGEACESVCSRNVRMGAG